MKVDNLSLNPMIYNSRLIWNLGSLSIHVHIYAFSATSYSFKLGPNI